MIKWKSFSSFCLSSDIIFSKKILFTQSPTVLHPPCQLGSVTLISSIMVLFVLLHSILIISLIRFHCRIHIWIASQASHFQCTGDQNCNEKLDQIFKEVPPFSQVPGRDFGFHMESTQWAACPQELKTQTRSIWNSCVPGWLRRVFSVTRDLAKRRSLCLYVGY